MHEHSLPHSFGVAALGGAVNPADLDAGLAELRRLGIEPLLARNLASREGLFAGSDRERVDGLHQLLEAEDPDVVILARGGHGMLRVLPLLDWDLISRRKRLFVGYSDVTPLLYELYRRFGWPSLHGPMVAADCARGLDDQEVESFRCCLSDGANYRVPVSRLSGDWVGVQGDLVGGCLSLLAATQGGPYGFSAQGRLLFWEDVNEPLFRLDRMWQQLKMSSALDGVLGVVVGAVSDENGVLHPNDMLSQLVRDAVGPVTPIALGVPSGHVRPNLTLVLGAPASVDAEASQLVMSLAEK